MPDSAAQDNHQVNKLSRILNRAGTKHSQSITDYTIHIRKKQECVKICRKLIFLCGDYAMFCPYFDLYIKLGILT